MSPFLKSVTFGLANVCLTNSGSAFAIPGLTTAGAGCIGDLGRNRFVMPNFFQWDMRLSRRMPSTFSIAPTLPPSTSSATQARAQLASPANQPPPTMRASSNARSS